MAVLEIDQYKNTGVIKELDANSMELIYKNIQTEYQFPIESFVRETFANGMDSVREREIAKKIIIDKEPISKYYLTRNEAIVKDSNFDPNYYNFKYLSSKKEIQIIQTYRDNHSKDLVRIIDEGVGLSGSRLKGYFKLNYSSKRNSHWALGKFGSGAKAGLATNVEFFKMTTRYNGKETSFLIYLENYECIIPKHKAILTDVWKVKRMKAGIPVDFDFPVYWVNTNKPNGVEIELEMRKSHRTKFYNAVKDQLLYFQDDVKFFRQYTDENSELDLISIKQEIIFETDNCVVSKYNQFNSPHIIIEGMNYGRIPWSELDLETKSGRIGLKVPASDISVSQSREVVKWDSKSRQTILNSIDLVTADVTNYLEDTLKTEHLIEWVLEAKNIIHTFNDPIISAVSGFIDRSNIKLTKDITEFWDKLDKKVQKVIPKVFKPTKTNFNNLFACYNVTSVTRNASTKNDATSFQDMSNPLIIIGNPEIVLTKKLHAYIFSTLKVDSFLYIRLKNFTNETLNQRINKDSKVTFKDSLVFSNLVLSKYGTDLNFYKITKEFETTWNLNNKEINEQEFGEPEPTLSKEELRKLNGSVYAKVLSKAYNFYGRINPNHIVLLSEEYIVEDIKDIFKDKTVIWGNQKHRDLLILLQTMNIFNGTTSDCIILQISQQNSKHFKNYNFVETYLKEKIPDGFKLGKLLKDFNTLYAIYQECKTFPLLENIREIAISLPEFKSKISFIQPFIDTIYNFRSSDMSKKELFTLSHTSGETSNALLDYMDKTVEINMLLFNNNEKAATVKCKEYFGTDKFINIDAIDLEILKDLQEIIETLKPIEDLISIIDFNNKKINDKVATHLILLRKTLTSINN